MPKVRPERGGPFHAEIVVTGRELLRGHVADETGRLVAETLARRGALVHRITIVDDQARAIRDAILEALGRNPRLVVVTGGLGPAPDDRTLDAVADALGLPLKDHADARSHVEELYRALRQARLVASSGMNLAREKLTRLPIGSAALPNPTGVASGVLCRLAGGAAVVCLPGLPEEAGATLERALARLADLLPRHRLATRQVESPTPDESELRPMLEMLAREHGGVWVSSRPLASPRAGKPVLVTLEATAATKEEANQLVAKALRRLLALAAGSR